ncbi:hypothetical protein CSE16_10870 [Solibacillus sp. R5-41]|uniref:hypothetical protein n=1 Tax=Solibacillus sp. R5-41 TaxID=2048654 RepID=UPI000C1250FD|nr:hypothetical protein [Solibacillus sp. R5-41]ATP40509.1 hypothetical protein CSE16_10870 [Solibacillus sp. R5-41]
MKKEVVVLLSMLFGLIVSAIVSISILFATKFFTGGVMDFGADKWMYMTLTIPVVIGFGVLGAYFYNHANLSNKQMWKITLISVLAISLLSGTVGTIISDVLIYGSEGVNFDGRIIWGVLYSIFALPITLFIGKLLIEILAEFVASVKKKDA